MSRATPQMRGFAARLITYETAGKDCSTPGNSAAVLVCETLRPHLSMLMGKTGYSSLLSRALLLTTVELPWMRAIQVDTQGRLAGWDALGPETARKEVAEGSEVLIAHLLGLLIAFVGEDLTLRMVRDRWTKMTLADLSFRKEDTK